MVLNDSICLKRSNRKLSVEVLLELRKKVVYTVVAQGIKKTKAAKLFDFSLTSVSKYGREFKLYGCRETDTFFMGVIKKLSETLSWIM